MRAVPASDLHPSANCGRGCTGWVCSGAAWTAMPVSGDLDDTALVARLRALHRDQPSLCAVLVDRAGVDGDPAGWAAYVASAGCQAPTAPVTARLWAASHVLAGLQVVGEGRGAFRWVVADLRRGRILATLGVATPPGRRRCALTVPALEIP
ncbi:MAG: hypothetical protein RLZZ127_2111 [Planctomycetota bacterium]|jgi:hypothetical protein